MPEFDALAGLLGLIKLWVSCAEPLSSNTCQQLMDEPRVLNPPPCIDKNSLNIRGQRLGPLGVLELQRARAISGSRRGRGCHEPLQVRKEPDDVASLPPSAHRSGTKLAAGVKTAPARSPGGVGVVGPRVIKLVKILAGWPSFGEIPSRRPAGYRAGRAVRPRTQQRTRP